MRFYIMLCMWLGSLTSFAQAQTQFGRYLGVLKHAQIEQDQLAKLDFIVDRQSGTKFKMIAVLSLYFGDFNSREYVSYHFDSVNFNVLTGALVFDQPDQGVTLIAEHFGSGNFTARLRSTSAGDIGVLQLTQSSSVIPERDLVQPLWGEYRGTCDDVRTVLQVQTQRSSGDTSRMGNPFGTYDVSAQLAEVDPSACLDGSTLCVVRTFDSGVYNFFKGSFDLVGKYKTMRCKVSGMGLSCDKCTLRRTSNEASTSGEKAYPTSVGGYSGVPMPGGNEPSVKPAASTSLSGTYSGYLFHERLGVYQAVSLNIASYQATGASGNPSLFVSAVSSMYFGGFDSPEYVNHRFNEREFPLLSPQIVLERIEGDVDAVVQLTQLGNGTARGIWYSVLFGRVGTFELKNGVQPPPPSGAKLMAPLSGKYQNGDWKLDLNIVRESTPVNTVNPFYPLTLQGTFRLENITANIRIASGAYDFYTGKIGFKLEDDIMFSGFRDGDHLMLKRPTAGILRPLIPHKFQTFEKVTQ